MNKKTIEFAFMLANMDEESWTNILLDLIDSQQKPEESESEDDENGT